MKVTSEKIDNHTTILNMEIPQEDVAKALDKAYKDIANKTNIPGFRKGKAPRKIIEARVGKKALLNEAFDMIAPEAYNNALEQENIDPVAPPNIEIVTLEEDAPLVFKATVVGRPEVVLGEYKGLNIEKPKAEVSDETINDEIEKIRKRYAKLVPAENDAELKKGDMPIISFEGFIDDKPLEGVKGESFPLQIGSGRFVPGFEDQLIGAKAGDELEVFVTFPDNYPEYPGENVKFAVKIEDVKCEELPELDDEFAKEASEFETFAEFKADIKNKLEYSAKTNAEQQYVNDLVQKATENATLEVPDIMIENQLDGILESIAFNMKMRGVNFDAYLAYNKLTIEDIRNKNRETALKEVSNDLVLSAIAQAEKITVEPDDLREEADNMAKMYGTTREDVLEATLKTNRLVALQNAVVRKKAAKLILDNAAAQ